MSGTRKGKRGTGGRGGPASGKGRGRRGPRRRNVAGGFGRAVGRFLRSLWRELAPKPQSTGGGPASGASGGGRARAAGPGRGPRGAGQPGRNESWEAFLARRPDIAAQIAGRVPGAGGGQRHPGAAHWRQIPAGRPAPRDQDDEADDLDELHDPLEELHDHGHGQGTSEGQEWR